MALSVDRINGVTGDLAIKTPVRVATTANITLSGLQTIDGVLLVADDRVLVKNQTDAVDNGIWSASTSSWSRALDFDGRFDVVQGTVVPVVLGTANAGSAFKLDTASPVIGTTSLSFSVANDFALRADLASTASGKGAALVGFLGFGSVVSTLSALATSAGASLLGWIQAGTGAVARSISSRLRDVVSVKDFGAVGDGTTDDTAAIQAAINAVLAYGGAYCVALYIPPGKYKLTATININVNNYNFAMYGAGPLASQFVRSGNYGDTFALTTLPAARFSNFGVQMSTEMTTGAHFNCVGLYHVKFDNMKVSDGYVNFRLRGCSGVTFAEMIIEGGQYFTDAGYKGGSANLKLETYAGGANNGIGVSNSTLDPNSLTPETNSKYQSSVIVEEVDGFWMSNTHIAGGGLSHLGINPVAGKTLTGVKLTNCWLDYWALNNLSITPAGTQVVQNIEFDQCTFQGSTDQLISVDNAYLTGLKFTGCTFEFGSLGAGNVIAGKHITWSGCTWKGNNGGAANGSTLTITSANVIGVSISGGTMDAGPSVLYNINTGAVPPSRMTVDGVSFGGAGTTDIYVTGTPAAPNKLTVGNCNSDLLTNVASAAALAIPTVGDVFQVTGNTNVSSILADRGWRGRRITLVFQSNLTVSASANLIMPAGNLVTSATNYSTLDLLCRDGVMWVEISRRA